VYIIHDDEIYRILSPSAKLRCEVASLKRPSMAPEELSPSRGAMTSAQHGERVLKLLYFVFKGKPTVRDAFLKLAAFPFVVLLLLCYRSIPFGWHCTLQLKTFVYLHNTDTL
jgi:hypothetical protein